MNRPLTPEEEATMRGCDEQDFASDSEPMRLWATLDAEREKVRVLREALWKAAVRLEILTGRMRGCHAETGRHELMDEAEMFCAEARAALNGWCPPNTDRALATTEPKP